MKALKFAMMLTLCVPAQVIGAGNKWIISGLDKYPITLCVPDPALAGPSRVAGGNWNEVSYQPSRGALGDFVDTYLSWPQTEPPVVGKASIGWEVYVMTATELNGQAFVTRLDLAPTFGERYQQTAEHETIQLVDGRGVTSAGDITVEGFKVANCDSEHSAE